MDGPPADEPLKEGHEWEQVYENGEWSWLQVPEVIGKLTREEAEEENRKLQAASKRKSKRSRTQRGKKKAEEEDDEEHEEGDDEEEEDDEEFEDEEDEEPQGKRRRGRPKKARQASGPRRFHRIRIPVRQNVNVGDDAEICSPSLGAWAAANVPGVFWRIFQQCFDAIRLEKGDANIPVEERGARAEE